MFGCNLVCGCIIKQRLTKITYDCNLKLVTFKISFIRKIIELVLYYFRNL